MTDMNDYDDVEDSTVDEDEAKAAAKQNQNPVQRAMSVLAEIFTPLIPAIVVGGAYFRVS